MILEACVGNLQEALIAENKGAHQIELCDRLDLDGTSPTIDTIKKACDQLKIPIKVIVNPNPFNYSYSEDDIQNIIDYIKQLNALPIHGIVFGPLTKEGLPDLDILDLVADHTNLPITYHKAIDTSSDILQSTSMLLEQNKVKYILTSGGEKTALLGAKQILEMQSILKNSKIELIGAGKITSANLNEFHENLNLKYYHGKKIVGDLHSSI